MADIDKLEASARTRGRCDHCADDEWIYDVDPATILALVERVERLEAVAAAARSLLGGYDRAEGGHDGDEDHLRAAIAALDDKDKETTSGN